MDKEKYLNEMLYRMEEVFYHELSDCAPWKTELVGIDYIQSQDVQGTNEKEIIESCIDTIKAAGLVRDIKYSISHEDILLKLRVRGCFLMLKETLLKKSGVKPYNCPIANMIHDQLIEKLNYTTTYLAGIHADEASGQCDIQSAIYATPDKIGAVSDWTKD